MGNLKREIILLIEKEFAIKNVVPENKIKELGFSSFTFVRLIVKLEEVFSINFDFEFLDYEKFECVNDVIQYVEMCQKAGN